MTGNAPLTPRGARHWRSSRGRVGLLVVVGAAVLALAATAQAGHTVRVDHPSDGSWGTIGSNHHAYAVCDSDPDGHETWLRIWQHYDPEPFSTGRDSYGNNRSGQFCFHSQVPGFPIRRALICVSYEGCSRWYPVTE